MSSNGDIVSSATCAVFIDGKIQGTAWLASRNGHLLTAGHILGRESPIDKVYVRFGNGELKLAMKVFWMYNRENGMDFAVLRLKKYFPDQPAAGIKSQ